MKTYSGIREPLCHVRVLDDAAAGLSFALPPLPGSNGSRPSREHELSVPRELVAQALVPFEWGIEGPGTHYLAVAFLADLLGPADRTAIKLALPFMRRFLSRLPKDDFEISETVFRAFLYAVSGAFARPRVLPGKPSSDVPGGDAAREAERDRTHSPEHTRPADSDAG